MKRVLIAHQSSIPHYRIPFYNSLEQLRPCKWCFDVVFDPLEIQKKKYFGDEIDSTDIQFPTLEVDTKSLAIGGRTLTYQSFWLRARQYDLIIVEDAINNLTYPLSNLHQFAGTKIAYWGLGKDRKIDNHNPLTYFVTELKLFLNRSADGYFAYTEGVKEYLALQGVPEEKIFTVNNTIDINMQRSAFEKLIKDKEIIKKQLGVSVKKVLLFVSTFKESKKAGFLLKAFSILREMDNDFYMLLVGSGGEDYLDELSDNITYFGSVTAIQKLASIYVASDIFVYPGQVGLAPLQALCYNLPVITIDSKYIHGPEIEYLTPVNSIIMNSSTNPEEYAKEISNLFKDNERLKIMKSNTWSSIQHLTVEQMAYNFIDGINTILEL